MNESRAITGLDRLPWLADEREAPRRRARSSARAIAIALLIMGVAALSYWLGTKSWTLFPDPEPAQESAAPIPLPEATPALPELGPFVRACRSARTIARGAGRRACARNSHRATRENQAKIGGQSVGQSRGES